MKDQRRGNAVDWLSASGGMRIASIAKRTRAKTRFDTKGGDSTNDDRGQQGYDGKGALRLPQSASVHGIPPTEARASAGVQGGKRLALHHRIDRRVAAEPR